MVLLPQGTRNRPFPAGFLAETHIPPYPCDYATPLNINQAEQGVAPQSATRSESDSEGDDNPQPESEARSR
jgi:hypothetical protein